MIEQQARISQVEAGKATITMASVSGCPACDAGQGCGAGIFGRLVRRNPVSLELNVAGGATQGLAPGQLVMVGIPESLFLSLLARLYLLPLLAGLAGAVAGHYLALVFALQGFAQDLLALLGALILFALTLLLRRSGGDSAMVHQQVQLLHSIQAKADPALQQNCQRPAR
jgi:sigma-E factor negative regulatory protein RseC